ncbi:MAG TPA: HAMP domain-containing protein, partial [Polyangiaceae bacterium]|nr:HAMP domain-containing protein [Polyangiaceae bacterium]
MRLTVKLKLLLLVCAALLSLALVVGVSESISRTQQSALDDAERRLLPRLELGPKLDAEFVRLRQGIQDAVAAQDLAALDATMANKTRIFDLINGAGAALEPSLAASLRWSVQDYFEIARGVSRRLIAGEVGEDIVDGMRDMQERQRRAEAAIRKAAGLDRTELNASFARVRAAAERATRLRLGLGLGAVSAVLLLWLWASGRVLRALRSLSEGFQRFEQGDLTHTIRVEGNDELGDVTREANRLASSLRSSEQRRARDDWIRDGLAELSRQLQGSLMPDVVAERVLGFVVERTRA